MKKLISIVLLLFITVSIFSDNGKFKTPKGEKNAYVYISDSTEFVYKIYLGDEEVLIFSCTSTITNITIELAIDLTFASIGTKRMYGEKIKYFYPSNIENDFKEWKEIILCYEKTTLTINDKKNIYAYYCPFDFQE